MTDAEKQAALELLDAFGSWLDLDEPFEQLPYEAVRDVADRRGVSHVRDALVSLFVDALVGWSDSRHTSEEELLERLRRDYAPPS